MRRLPDEIKKQKGTFRKDRQRGGLNIKPIVRHIEPPTELNLDEFALKIWDFQLNEILYTKILTQQDLILFAVFCIEASRYFRNKDIVDKKGETYKDKNGYLKERPELKIMNKSFSIMYDIANKFGFTPISRDMIRGVDKGEKKDALSEIIEM